MLAPLPRLAPLGIGYLKDPIVALQAVPLSWQSQADNLCLLSCLRLCHKTLFPPLGYCVGNGEADCLFLYFERALHLLPIVRLGSWILALALDALPLRKCKRVVHRPSFSANCGHTFGTRYTILDRGVLFVVALQMLHPKIVIVIRRAVPRFDGPEDVRPILLGHIGIYSMFRHLLVVPLQVVFVGLCAVLLFSLLFQLLIRRL